MYVKKPTLVDSLAGRHVFYVNTSRTQTAAIAESEAATTEVRWTIKSHLHCMRVTVAVLPRYSFTDGDGWRMRNADRLFFRTFLP